MSNLTKKWLEDKYREWRNDQPRGADDVVDFADYLGVSRNSMNNWINRGATPTAASADKLADKLGPEIYDILGLPRPDPVLARIIKNWGHYPDEALAEFRETAARWDARGIETVDRKGLVKPKRR